MDYHLQSEGQRQTENQQKAAFQSLLFKDVGFTDIYWQQSVEDVYSRSEAINKVWMLREKVDCQHGAGEAGRTAVQKAIDAGIYLSRKVTKKDSSGNKIEIEEVAVVEQEERQSHVASFGSKHRAGGQSTEQNFKDNLMTVMCSADGDDEIEDCPIKKRPAAQLAITNGSSESGDTPVLKKPAAAGTKVKITDLPAVIKRRPAAASSGASSGSDGPAPLTADNVAAHSREQEDQNTQLNGCISQAMKLVQQRTMQLSDVQHRMSMLTLHGCQGKFQDTIQDEITETLDKLVGLSKEIQTTAIKERGIQFAEQKVALLNRAGTTLSEAEELVKTGEQLIKHNTNVD